MFSRFVRTMPMYRFRYFHYYRHRFPQIKTGRRYLSTSPASGGAGNKPPLNTYGFSATAGQVASIAAIALGVGLFERLPEGHRFESIRNGVLGYVDYLGEKNKTEDDWWNPL
jgi:hypothetical protein